MDEDERPPAAVAPVPEVEARLVRLEQGVRSVADAVSRSHEELSAAIRELRAAIAGAADPHDVREMIDVALDPISLSVTRLEETIRGLPLVLSASNERLFERAARAAEPSRIEPSAPAPIASHPSTSPAGEGDDSQPRLSSEMWSETAWGRSSTASPGERSAGDIPAQPFDEAPDGVDERGEWFWIDREDGEAEEQG